MLSFILLFCFPFFFLLFPFTCESSSQRLVLQVKHELNEGGVVDQAVLVGVGLLDHLLQLLLGELLAEVCHNMPQLSHREEALAVLVKHLEGLPHLLIRWVGFQGTGGVLGELVKGQGRTSLSGELFQLSLSGVQAKRAHHKAKIFGLNGALALLVVVAEALEVTGLLLLIKRLKKLKKNQKKKLKDFKRHTRSFGHLKKIKKMNWIEWD